MKGFIAGAVAGVATTYVVGAVGSVVSMVRSPEMGSHPVYDAERIVAGIALAAIWPYHAYMAVQEWNP